MSEDEHERRRLEQRLRESEERFRRLVHQSRRTETELRELTARLQSYREEELGRIAREVHDELGQHLTALKLDIEWLQHKVRDRSIGSIEVRALAEEQLPSMRGLAETAIMSLRRVVRDLRPPVLDDLGLRAAVEWQVSRFSEQYPDLTCVLEDDTVDLCIDRDRDTALFRILQEALTNVARHARACRVEVQLLVDGADLVLEVRDDGDGVSDETVDRPSMGIVGMRERARACGGTLELRRDERGGTVVMARVPRRTTGAG